MVKDLVSSAMLLLSFSCKTGPARYVLFTIWCSSLVIFFLLIDF